MELRLPRLGLAQARRILLLQGRLRSNEPTQILVGAIVTGLHWGVDWAHGVIFNIAGNHTISTGIGIDVQRILIVPVLGGLILGIGAVVMRRLKPTDVVDPIEANAL